MDDGRPTFASSCTPLRVSFAGGGTDLPEFYRNNEGGGAVLSAAIDKHLYVTVKRHSAIFDEKYRLNYSTSELVNSVDEIKNDIVRECIKFLDIDDPLYISVIADLPHSSGLGSSSAFAVGLLNAFHMLRGEKVTVYEIAEEAFHVENRLLGRPVGKQDHYAAAVGGLNFYRFLSDERVSVEAASTSRKTADRLFDQVLMFWTGITRDSSAALTDMQSRMPERTDDLRSMRSLAEEIHQITLSGGPSAEFGRLLNENWILKRDLGSKITSPQINTWYDRALSAGALGGKLCGAGGGGFLLFLAEQDMHDNVTNALADLQRLDVELDPHGSRILAVA